MDPMIAAALEEREFPRAQEIRSILRAVRTKDPVRLQVAVAGALKPQPVDPRGQYPGYWQPVSREEVSRVSGLSLEEVDEAVEKDTAIRLMYLRHAE
ncbi:hypothetical protein FNH13_17595 [Ornithinimicrobium ciconiae]|uniref:Uncharacterized protein n=1 Tax=Ornithinimicrobium ciconiae TaxID=2594265 RepID=A0A516GEI0_9MICO|nr:hypothetical protein [Ornithinimicrobium ciconiae]QDO89915.1 hypothetical protein FNH13_17595 [Ornithinimicrobium ciconiae]